MKQTVATLIAKTLDQAGVKRIWGVTGDSLNGLSDSLHRMGTIEWLGTRHEEVAPSPPAPKPSSPASWRCAPAPAAPATCT